MALVFVSRLPFLDTGYGSEEDAWGLFLTAKNIALNSKYEVSRLPGHPVQELFYAFIWKSGARAYNVITALISTLGFAFFVGILRSIGIRNYFVGGLTLAFVPVVYINSTNSMDYTWALAFTLASWFLVTERKYLLAGVALGIACGCRITALAMFIPILFYIFEPGNFKISLKNIIVYGAASVVTSVLVFVPVLINYGTDFFMYYKHWPYPPVLKSLYKFTIAPFGILGFIDLLSALLISVILIFKKPFYLLNYRYNLVIFSIVTGIVLYSVSFWMVPFKSAFLIPIIPFLILFLGIHLKELQFKALCFSMLISCFFFGLNLNQGNNSATPSSMSYHFKAGGNNLVLDLWNGPLKEDMSKRTNRQLYAGRIISGFSDLETPCVLITGYWYNFVLGQLRDLNKPDDIKFAYYLSEEEIRKFRSENIPVYVVSDQSELNDTRFQGNYTAELTIPFEPN